MRGTRRLVDPEAVALRHVEKRSGVKTSGERDREISATKRFGNAPRGLSMVVGKTLANVRKLVVDGSGVSVAVQGDTATLTFTDTTGGVGGASAIEEVDNTTSINLTITDVTLTADANFGTTAGTVAAGDHTHGASGMDHQQVMGRIMIGG